MLSLLVFVLVAALLLAVAVIAFVMGMTLSGKKTLQALRDAGWTIKPPDLVEEARHDEAG